MKTEDNTYKGHKLTARDKFHDRNIEKLIKILTFLKEKKQFSYEELSMWVSSTYDGENANEVKFVISRVKTFRQMILKYAEKLNPILYRITGDVKKLANSIESERHLRELKYRIDYDIKRGKKKDKRSDKSRAENIRNICKSFNKAIVDANKLGLVVDFRIREKKLRIGSIIKKL